MPSTVLITGASTGIGNLTARALAAAGHNVYASVHNLDGKNAAHAHVLTDFAKTNGFDLKVVVLDVQSQDSANAAVKTILDEAGQLDVVVHNAGHLVIGYAEAFTAEDLAHLFDVNVFGLQRVNRAVLPQMRAQRAGLLVYVSSTSAICLPPFLAPYVASKSAFDALAATTAYEVGQFGIETCIVMPGAFTTGTDHFPNATHASDQKVTAAYGELDPRVARNEAATNQLFEPGVDVNPKAVAEEITRVLALPVGERPRRTVVDFCNAGIPEATDYLMENQRNFVTRMGYEDLLKAKVTAAKP